MDQITIISNRKTHHVSLQNILYLESELRKVYFYTSEKKFEVYDKIDRFETELCSRGFIRCHQSFLVSTAHISSYDSNTVYIGNVHIPISKKYKKSLIHALSEKRSSDVSIASPGITPALRLHSGLILES